MSKVNTEIVNAILSKLETKEVDGNIINTTMETTFTVKEIVDIITDAQFEVNLGNDLELYSEKPITCNLSLYNFNSALYLDENNQIGRLDSSSDFFREKQDYSSSLSGSLSS